MSPPSPDRAVSLPPSGGAVLLSPIGRAVLLSPIGRAVLLSPGDGHAPTGGDRYDRAVIDALRGQGWQVDRLAASPRCPRPTADDLAALAGSLAALPAGQIVIADGLAFGAMPDLARAQAGRLRWLALVHHPLHRETGLAADDAARLRQAECEALRWARAVVVTSEATRADVQAMGVPAGRITVIEPLPTVWPTAAVRRPAAAEPQLLCVGALTPRKGHARLLTALAAWRALPWTLHCVGCDRRDPATADALRAQAEALGLSGRVHWHGEVDEAALAAHYAQADGYVAAPWHEGYGMALAEALAHGLPAVSTATGLAQNGLPPDTGWTVPVDDEAALGGALGQLLARLNDGAHERPRLGRAVAGEVDGHPARQARQARQACWAARWIDVLRGLDDVAGLCGGDVDAAAPAVDVGASAMDASASAAALPPAAQFSADWLALREPHDRAARARAAGPLHLADWAARRQPAARGTVLDLGCGSGSNLRALAPALGGARQTWHVVDHDAALEAAWPAAMAAAGWRRAPGRGATQAAARADRAPAPERPVAASMDQAWQAPEGGPIVTRHWHTVDLTRGLADVPWAGVGLVSGSALLDLVSPAWLDALVGRIAAARADACFTLSVDGRHEWTPADPDDDAVAAAFAAHQRRDKGFGPALGAAAPAAAADRLRAQGYAVRLAASDWRFDVSARPGDAAIVAALIDGMAGAAAEQQPAEASRWQGWAGRRRAVLATTRLLVGHQDLLAEAPAGAAPREG